jgi:hypothetical protein
MEGSKESLKKRVEELLKKYNTNSSKYTFLQKVLEKLNDEKLTLHIAEGVNPDRTYKYCQDVIEKYFDGVNKCLGICSNASFFPGKETSINIYIVSYILNITDMVNKIIEKMKKMKNKDLKKKHRKLSISGCTIRNYSWSSADALLSLGVESIVEEFWAKHEDGSNDITVSTRNNWFYEKEDKSSPYVSLSELFGKFNEVYNSDFNETNPPTDNNLSINCVEKPRPPEKPTKNYNIIANLTVREYKL